MSSTSHDNKTATQKERVTGSRMEELLELATSDIEALAAVVSDEQLDKSQREQLAFECARYDGLRTARLIQNFGIKDQGVLVDVAKACLEQHGFAAQYFLNFNIQSEDERAQLAQVTESLHAPWGVPQFFKEFQIENQDTRIAIAQVWAEASPFRTAWHFRNFEIADPEQRCELGECIAQLDPRRALIHLDKFDLDGHPELEKAIVKSAFASNFETTREYGGAAYAHLLLDDSEFPQILEESLKRGCVENALSLERERASLEQQRFVPAHESVEALDLLVRNLHPTTDGELAETIKCYLHLRDAEMQPTDTIVAAYRVLGEEITPFLDSIIPGSGESFGDQICEALLELYGDSGTIPAEDQQLIRAFLSRSFQGFSAQTFSRFQEVALESRIGGYALVDEWQSLSKKMLEAREISYEDTRHPLYAEVAFAAYRPKGVALSHYKTLAPHIESFPEHLEGVIAEDHCRLDLDSHVKIVVREGREPDLEVARQLAQSVHRGTVSSSHAEALVPKLIRGSITREELVTLIGEVAAGIDEEHVRSLPEAEETVTDPGTAHRFLADLGEIVMQQVPERLSAYAAQVLDDDSSRSLDAAISATLGVTGEVSQRERAAALAIRFAQEVRPIEKYLNGELRKYECEGGGAAVPLDGHLSKAHHAFLARAGADLSSALDFVSWESPDYLQVSLTERLSGRYAGVIQFHRFQTESGEEGLLARINATPNLARKVSPEAFAASTVELAKQIAHDNKWTPFLPEQADFHALTNRLQHVEALQSHADAVSIPVNIDITDSHTVEAVFRVR